MKFILAFLIAFASVSGFGASPSYGNFNTNDFTTNAVTAGQVIIGLQDVVITPSTSFIPNLFFEVFMDEHFGCGRNGAAEIGKFGWTPADTGGGGLEFGTEPYHWGTLRVRSTSLIGSSQTMFCGRAMNNRPTIPPLNATIGWTNRVIWRMVGTNSCRVWLSLTDATAFSLGAGARQQTISIFLNTTNSTQIMGHTTTTDTAGTTTTTNLGTLQDNTWYTNEIWSHISGVICYNLNGGAMACVSNNITVEALIPAMAVVKTVDATETNILEIDEWFFVMTRP